MMLLIVAHHYVVNSGVFDAISMPPYTLRHYFLYIFGMWGKIGINCFVLITGYFMCKSDITVRKFLKLLLEVLFYNIIIYSIFAMTGDEAFSFAGIVRAFNPIKSIADGFVSCFLIYYLLIPFLNAMVNHISKRQHAILIGLCMLFFVLWDQMPGVEYRFNYVGWFCVLHIISSYIRFYFPTKEEVASNKNEMLLITAGGGIAVLAVIGQCYMIEKGWHVGWHYKWVADCNAIVGVISSIMMFIGFKGLRVKYSPFINGIASSTFAVLLIHTNSDTMRRWLWQDVCHNLDWVSSPFMPLYSIGCVLAIFAVCIIIDQVRIYVFEKPIFKIVDRILVKHGIKYSNISNLSASSGFKGF